MLTLISPAKSLDLESPVPRSQSTEPRLLDETARLAEIMAGKSVADLRKLMGVSEDIATLNVERYRDFQTGTPDTARPAGVTFDGAVYRGMDPQSFDTRDWTEAQKSLRILSGLYGVLRPLDRIQPYRLEMGTALRTRRGNTLVSWWGDQIRDLVSADLQESLGRVFPGRRGDRREDHLPALRVPGPSRTLEGHLLHRQGGPRPHGRMDDP